jgi:hypothetical protein
VWEANLPVRLGSTSLQRVQYWDTSPFRQIDESRSLGTRRAPLHGCDGDHISFVTMLVKVVNPIALFPAISLVMLRIEWACED